MYQNTVLFLFQFFSSTNLLSHFQAIMLSPTYTTNKLATSLDASFNISEINLKVINGLCNVTVLSAEPGFPW